ncbi:MAG: DEAD/DEAH box helicase [Rhodospirillales bacterium]|nr:DEAD/DEAH box helicase [Rhodospirillales bacterium]
MSAADIDQRSIEIALGALEELEFPSLAWGFVDSFITEDQLIAQISKAFNRHSIDTDVEDVVAELEERLLVRFWLSDDDRCYRSRFAELVRLTARSRQLFDNRPWRSSPTLVSDYRLDISPRRYPKRDISSENGKAEINAAGAGFTDLQEKVWGAVLAAGGMKSLSQFQVDAFKRIFWASKDFGTIITAGTGSGKTLSFYLPALLRVCANLQPGQSFTKVLSLYPRNELLKDQLTEVYKLARSANPTLQAAGKPKLSVGPLYGQVPLFPGETAVKDYSRWVWRHGGYLCPFLRCPECGSETVWKKEDLLAKREKVSCTSCHFASSPDELRLTRSSIRATPPDFLFTTTEMLNQRMSDAEMRTLFGIGCRAELKPSYILLDEVHTYTGTSGAQTALLLRRWRKMLSAPIHWVGLSATLEEAGQFFEDLTGLYGANVQEITPRLVDMEEEGADYQILVRSDPSSQAATLSTSIQCLMLLARMLDPNSNGPSKGLFGSRVFAFTDNLDVINRLYDDFRDAEAYKPWQINDPDPNREPLAQLRSRHEPDTDDRDLDGQLWSLAEDLRGNLKERLSIGRTTSRDPGVLNASDVVVATASLEVGFNDPDVGAVLQHKAPHSNASFVQRKGRAGRRRGMRPIMITVLSDYGRDRLAFQAYEELFSPQIERQPLPVSNGYILRMQAVCALFDWISEIAARNKVYGWSWKELSTPKDAKSKVAFLDIAKEVIKDLIQLEPNRVRSFREHLTKCLKIDDHALDLILWEQPRSLFLEVLPTLARRLFTDWRMANDQRDFDLNVPYHPLPDFMPRELFGELNLPEVTILVPPSSKYEEEREERLRIRQALTEFTPGKVRRRFADRAGNIAHWFPLDPEKEKQSIDINEYAERHEYLGAFAITGKGSVHTYRPWATRVAAISNRQRISHTSTAMWHWNSDFEFKGEAHLLSLPQLPAWKNIVTSLNFYLHRLASAVTVCRYAHSGVASLRVNGETRRIEFSLTDSDQSKPAAVGFAYESDAVCIPLQLPSADELAGLKLPPDVKRWLTTLRYRQRISSDGDLPNTINQFRRDWLMQVVWHAALVKSEEKEISLKDAFDHIAAKSEAYDLKPAIAQTISCEIIDDPSEAREAKLEQTLLTDLETEGVLERICKIGSETFDSEVSLPGIWIKEIYAQTLAEAALQACVLSIPKNTALEGLTVDLVENDDACTVVIVESTLGGGGTIEALADKFSRDPRSFFKAMEAALAPSDSENAAIGLSKILSEITKDESVTDSLSKMRRARDSREREDARIEFVKALGSRGIPYSRALGVSFSTRFVKASTSKETDELTKQLLEFWDRLEERHEVCLPVRLLASISNLAPSIKAALSVVGGDGNELSTAERLLWARGGELRQFGVQSYNTYREPWISDAGLVRSVIARAQIKVVSVRSDDWLEEVTEELVESGIVGMASNHDMDALSQSVMEIISKPVTVHYHNFYPVVDSYSDADDSGPCIVVTLREHV